MSQCFFRQYCFPPVYFHSCAPASYLKVPMLVLSSPFPVDLLVCSEAVWLRKVYLFCLAYLELNIYKLYGQ